MSHTSVRVGACNDTLGIHVGYGPSIGDTKMGGYILSLEESHGKRSVRNRPVVVVSVGQCIMISSPTYAIYVSEYVGRRTQITVLFKLAI